MRNLLLLLLIAVLLPAAARAQGFTEVAPPTDYGFVDRFAAAGGAHGVVVDDMNRVWFGGYSAQGIFCMWPDGTPCDFSPIVSLEAGGETISGITAVRGMTKDHEGNIVAVVNNTTVVRIDPDTGAGIDAFVRGASTAKPGVDGDGFLYAADVVSMRPIRVIDIESNYTEFATIGDDLQDGSQNSLTRAVNVSSDALNVFGARLSGSDPKVYWWQSEDAINYELADSLDQNADGAKIFAGEPSAVDFGPGGTLWVSDEGANAYRVFDLQNRTYWSLTSDSLLGQPRGVAFSVTGDTLYMAGFAGGYINRFVAGYNTAVDADETPAAFTLHQNYPNPFNPTTTIAYTLDKPMQVTVRVYDALGRVVRTLAAGEQRAPGTYRLEWDGRSQAGHPVVSGTYFSVLEADGFRASRPMVLLK